MSSVRKLVVEVIDAKDLLPKDGHGTSSPYAILHFYGQRKRTQTAIRDLSPTWNEVLEFNVMKQSDIFGDMLELDVFHDKNFGSTRRNNFLGRVRLDSKQFVKKGEEALIYYPLEKKHLFSWIQGEIGLKIYFSDEAPPLPVVPEVAEPEAEVKDVPAEKSEPPQESAPMPSPETPAVEPPPSTAEPLEEKDQSLPTTEPPPRIFLKERGSLGTEKDQSQPTKPPGEEALPGAKDNVLPSSDDEVLPDNACSDPMEPVHSQPMMQPEGGIGLNAFRATRSMSEVNIGGFNGPRPIPRSSSVSSFISEAESIPIERSSFDLVNKMHYLFIRVVRARSLPTNNGNPVVKIAVSGHQVQSKPARKSQFYEWDQTFAFNREAPDSSSMLEISVWGDMVGHDFLGGICFDVTEIPLRDPPDSPLAPQWYRLEGGGANIGDVMLATWVGTQADDSFPDAWKTDTAGNPSSRSKIYQSPKLWYLRVSILEGQDVLPLAMSKESMFQIRAQLGFQVLKTKSVISRNGSPSWNEDLMFVASEPFADHRLMLFLENRQMKEPLRLGVATIPLMSIERRVDDRQVSARWLSFEDPKAEKIVYKGRVHIRVCFDGGYHVMDEAAHVCSDYRPTARQLWKPPIGTIELGIVGCKNILPMKTIDGKGSTDAYVVAKYGNKWVRTRTISDCLDPKWNEQYTWRVHDPSTVLTIGIFDSWEVFEINGPNEPMRPDFRIGKVRIRVSTLKVGKVYRSTYPLIMLTPMGLKKMGEIELAVRFVRSTATLDFLHVYSQPLLPLMHHIKPLGMVQQEMLRANAAKIMAAHLARSEPPLPREVVTYMLDADSHTFSMRKVRANWIRIVNVVTGVIDVVKWVEETRSWKNPTATLLVHALLVLLVWYPDLIIPTLAFYVFAVGAWNYRFRSRDPLPHFDPKMSLAEFIDRDELDEEFDSMPSSRQNEIIRARYDKLRGIGIRVQTILGDIAAQGERLQALVTWRDPRATGIFVGLCFVVALILYLVPSKMIGMAFGFYYLRHPIFRDRMPSPVLNFFRRLPSLSDRLM